MTPFRYDRLDMPLVVSPDTAMADAVNATVAQLVRDVNHEREGLMLAGFFAFLLGDEPDFHPAPCEHRLPLMPSVADRYYDFVRGCGVVQPGAECMVCRERIEPTGRKMLFGTAQ